VVKRAIACLPVLGTQNCISHEGNSIKMPERPGIAVSRRRQAPEERDSRNVARSEFVPEAIFRDEDFSGLGRIVW
jgi:hypothetical protein